MIMNKWLVSLALLVHFGWRVVQVGSRAGTCGGRYGFVQWRGCGQLVKNEREKGSENEVGGEVIRKVGCI